MLDFNRQLQSYCYLPVIPLVLSQINDDGLLQYTPSPFSTPIEPGDWVWLEKDDIIVAGQVITENLIKPKCNPDNWEFLPTDQQVSVADFLVMSGFAITKGSAVYLLTTGAVEINHKPIFSNRSLPSERFTLTITVEGKTQEYTNV